MGNGTAGRETEAFVRESLKEQGLGAPVVMVSEAGASVYSASEIAREEFPDLDVTVRGAISIARRLQDPLAELVKIEPKSIGVGQYQHDVSASALKRSLEQVVDSCVNQVGVNLNTASEPLLAHVSGIGPAARQGHRRSIDGSEGLFQSRAELLDVAALQRQGLRAGRGLPAHAGTRQPARQHRRPPRALRAPRELWPRPSASRLADLLGRRRRARCARRAACATRSAPSPSTTS